MGYYFYKAKRAKAGPLIGKDLRLIAEKSMAKSLLIIFLAWFGGIATSISGEAFEVTLVVKVLIYLAVSLAGLVLLPKFWSWLLKRRKRKRAAQLSQQVMQVPSMKQEIS